MALFDTFQMHSALVSQITRVGPEFYVALLDILSLNISNLYPLRFHHLGLGCLTSFAFLVVSFNEDI